MGHFLSSVYGEDQVKRQTSGTAIPLLTAKNLGEIMVPMPSNRDVDLFAQLVEASGST